MVAPSSQVRIQSGKRRRRRSGVVFADAPLPLLTLPPANLRLGPSDVGACSRPKFQITLLRLLTRASFGAPKTSLLPFISLSFCTPANRNHGGLRSSVGRVQHQRKLPAQEGRLLLRFGCWELCLCCGPSHETTPHTRHSQPDYELWLVQEARDLCQCSCPWLIHENLLTIATARQTCLQVRNDPIPH